jgi:pyruvate,water dikinase
MVYFFGDGLAEGDPSRKDVLGGKGASLAAMTAAGLPVPPGFTVSIACCRHYHEHGGRWPDGLEGQVHAHMARLEKTTGRRFGAGKQPLLVSVRSGAAQSMPGMMDTILNCGLHPGLADQVADRRLFWQAYAAFVERFGNTAAGIPTSDYERTASAARSDRERAEAWIALYEQRTGKAFPTTAWDALRECVNAVFESWNSERAVVYRKAHGLEHLEGTAVSIQAMFNSRVSGVAFTANPLRPDANEIIIESSYGLGESIVSGDVTPDRFVVDSETLELKQRVIGNKAHMVCGLGDAEEERPAPGAASLTDAQVRELAGIARDVERHFGFPVDIEWGLRDGRFSLLQSRAVPELDVARDVEAGRKEETARLRQAVGKGQRVWVIHNLAETLPAPTPLTWDIIRRFMSGDGGYGRMYRDFGYRPGRRVCEQGFLELICGRTYADPDRAAEQFWEGLPVKYDTGELLREPALLESAPTHFDAARADQKFLLKLPGTLWSMFRGRRLTRQARREAVRRFNDTVLPPYLEYVRRKKEQRLSELTTEALIQEVHERIARVLDDFGKESLKPGYFGGMARAELERGLVQLMGPSEGKRLTNVLTSGLAGNITVEQNAAHYRVARGRESREAFLDKYGHRAVGEMELANPRCREDSSLLDRMVLAGEQDEEQSPEARHRRSAEKRQETMDRLPELLKECGGSCFREEVESLAAEAQTLLPYREIGKHYLMMGYELIRLALLELGRRFGIGHDLFFLHLDELGRFERERSNLTEKIKQRKTRWKSLQRLELPDVIDSAKLDDLGLPRQIAGAAELDAVPLSAGVSVGTARIIRHPGEAGDLGPDCILVCPSTDPSWTALFTRIKGLVVERGGVLSHGAITARDFGIPAVACADATSIVKDGARIRVDGDRGRVAIIQGRQHA